MSCECDGPGFCQRHGIMKSVHWWHLCQTSEKYFQAWEDGRGPGQNLGQGSVFTPVSKEHIAARMAICENCEHYKKERCVKIDLGCKNSFKAKVASARTKCPEGKWE